MNILITGGAGYLGGALTNILRYGSFNIRVYDSLLYEEAYLKEVPFVRGDVRDTQKLREHLEWADTVVWLAAVVGDGACALNPEVTTAVNQDAVKWLTENFNGRIVFTSTCSVYGAQDDLLDETSPTAPLSVYAGTKLAAEKYLKGKNAIIFRLGTLFGLGDQFSRIRLDLVVNTLTVRALTDGKLKIFGGEQYRPLLHVQDAARVIADNLRMTRIGVFNLHSQNARILDLAHEIVDQIPAEIEVVESTFEDSRNYRVSSLKAKQELHFKPNHRVWDGVREIKRVVEERRIKDLNSPRYSNQRFLEVFHAHN